MAAPGAALLQLIHRLQKPSATKGPAKATVNIQMSPFLHTDPSEMCSLQRKQSFSYRLLAAFCCCAVPTLSLPSLQFPTLAWTSTRSAICRGKVVCACMLFTLAGHLDAILTQL
jgi:hypothetical protein